LRDSRRNSYAAIPTTAANITLWRAVGRSPRSGRITPCSHSRGDGGCPFPCEPDLPADDAPALWSPALSVSTVRLDAAPIDAPDALPLDPSGIGSLLADRILPDGRHLVIADQRGVHRLWLTDPDPTCPVAIVTATGAGLLCRAEAGLRLARRIAGRAAGPLPSGLMPTALQRRRYARYLRLLDANADAATRREMARILYPHMRSFTARQWSGATERRTTQRAFDKARALVAGGYRALLGGA
tara:strand:- start:145 stop:870 length:726 start_codon:yes stop_codon:yes gene_type:complete